MKGTDNFSDTLGKETALSPYRALDLTGEQAMFCGKILADLGMDVIKIEGRGGSSSRSIGPFYHDNSDPNKSLFWFAFNTNKKGITLNIQVEEGRNIFLKLIRGADILIESLPVGYLEGLGLGYQALKALNPRLIMTSISPFGQTGPYRNYKACDLTLMAMGGQLYTSGDSDRPPVRISVPQAYLHASVHAAVGTLMALMHRHRTGVGQHVDVSAQAAVARLLFYEPIYWIEEGFMIRRSGPGHWRGPIFLREIWACRDGMVCLRIGWGTIGHLFKPLLEWMAEEGDIGIFRDMDVCNIDLYTLSSAQIEEMHRTVASFFMKHTKAELFDEAQERGFVLMPVSDSKEIMEDNQLSSRDFWHSVEHSELGTTIRYVGAPYKLSQTPWRIRTRAPLIGEHNYEIYTNLGFTPSQIEQMKSAGVI